MKKKNSVYSILFVLSILLYTSCGNNIISLDAENYAVYSNDDYTIKRISVFLRTFIIEKRYGAKGNSYIRLDSIGNDYNIKEERFSRSFDERIKFPIRRIPKIGNEEYRIINSSNEDASAYLLSFILDDNGCA